MMRAVLALLFALTSGPAAAQSQTFPAFLTGLSAPGAITGSELLYLAQGGVSKKFTLAQLYAQISGDLAIGPTGVGVLSTVNSNVGSFGSATECVTVTTNAKGLVTAASATTCTPAFSSLTGTAGVNANVLNTQTANYSVATTDCGKTIQLGTGSSGLFTITAPAVGGFPATCSVVIVNGDTTRAKIISGLPNSSLEAACTQGVTGSSDCFLWPKQQMRIAIVNGAWALMGAPGRWEMGSTTIQMYVNGSSGSNPGNDCLSSSAPCQTLARAVFSLAFNAFKFNSAATTQVKVNFCGTSQTSDAIHLAGPFIGSEGNAKVTIDGTCTAGTGPAVTLGTVTGGSAYTSGSYTNVPLTGGAGTEARANITVSGGAVTAVSITNPGINYAPGNTLSAAAANIGGTGSGFSVPVTAIAALWSTVNSSPIATQDFATIQIQNIILGSSGAASNCLEANRASHIIFVNLMFNACAGAQIYASNSALIEGSGFYTVNGSAAFSVQSFFGSVVNFVGAVNFAADVGFTDFVFSQAGVVNFTGSSVNLNGHTVTGTRFGIEAGGYVYEGSVNGNLTFFPGNVGGYYRGGGAYDAVPPIVLSDTATTVSGQLANANLGNMNANTIKCNNTGGAAVPIDCTVPQSQALLATPFIVITATAVNFNSVADTAITIPTLPTGFTRLRLQDVTVSHPSAAIASASVAVFTNTAGTGLTLLASTALSGITTTAENTAANAGRFPGITTADIQPSSLPLANTVYVRNTVAQGTAVTGDVTLVFAVLP